MFQQLDDEHPTRATRRGWLVRSSSLSAALGWFGFNQAAHAGEDTPLAQPDAPTPKGFMHEAFAMKELAVARGDQGYGAILVRDGRIVGAAPSRVVVNRDPTAHAEMEAIRDTARRLQTRDLGGCVMYSSSPPCPMCEAAAYWAGVAQLYHGSGITDGGRPRLC